jgi:NADH-quinone oxidoreductase subunit M
MISWVHLCLLAMPWLAALLGPSLTRRRALLAVSISLTLGTLLLSADLPAPVTTWIFSLDSFNVWLLPYTTVIYLAILLCTPRAERTRGSTHRLLLGLGLDLVYFSSTSAGILAVVWLLTHVNLLLEVGGASRRLVRILCLYLGAGCLLFGVGAYGMGQADPPAWAYGALTLGIVLRKAIVPFHQWLPELIEKGPMGHVIAFCAPQLGAYALVRLLAPTAPQSLLIGLGAASLVTAVYGACLACGRRSFRGTYAGLFMGQTSLVFAGLQCTTHASLAGGLALWISGGLALTGLGLTVWALIARRGRLNLESYQGGYERSPMLATSFLLFGLTSCGFPGTLGFLSQDLLLQGTTQEYPHIGVLVAATTALNSITLMRAYLHLFCGSPAHYSISQSLRPRERLAMLLLLAPLFVFGLFPVRFLISRWQAANHILQVRLSR